MSKYQNVKSNAHMTNTYIHAHTQICTYIKNYFIPHIYLHTCESSYLNSSNIHLQILAALLLQIDSFSIFMNYVLVAALCKCKSPTSRHERTMCIYTYIHMYRSMCYLCTFNKVQYITRHYCLT